MICPIYITLGRKEYTLTLSQYRNWHYRTSNALKKKFKEIIAPQIEGKTIKEPYGLSLKIYYKRKGVDLDNLSAVCTKFLNDSLVELGCVSDDNVSIFTELHCVVRGQDKERPRIEVTII